MDLITVAYIVIAVGLIVATLDFNPLDLPEVDLRSQKKLVGVANASLGIGALIGAVGICIIYYYGSTNQTLTAMSTFIVGLIIAVPTVKYLVRSYRSSQEAQENARVIDTPEANELAALKGRIGKTVSMLRPSGIADFNGRRVDVITEGLVIEEGQWVKCVEVKAGRVIVRPSDHPPLGDLEKFDFS